MRRTARETLAAAFPEHGWHSVVNHFIGSRGIQIDCSCGEMLMATSVALVNSGLSMDDVKAGIANAPRITKA